jgi:hypothetical protein
MRLAWMNSTVCPGLNFGSDMGLVSAIRWLIAPDVRILSCSQRKIRPFGPPLRSHPSLILAGDRSLGVDRLEADGAFHHPSRSRKSCQPASICFRSARDRNRSRLARFGPDPVARNGTSRSPACSRPKERRRGKRPDAAKSSPDACRRCPRVRNRTSRVCPSGWERRWARG